MSPIEQHRRLAVRSCELQSARGGHVCRLHLCDHARQRSGPQRVFGHCEELNVLAALTIEQLFRAKTHLLETRCVEIEGCDGPKDVEVPFLREACCYSSQEQSGGGIVIQACRSGRDFMQPRPVKSAIGKPSIERPNAERQRQARCAIALRDRFTQSREPIPVESRR